ncbi:N [Telok Forest virus]|uniref:Nucleoprotein n=1 Tax=Telok Forest virus TaxID=2748198 RepID=A0A7D9MVT8_9VIRU|nr:N [Telok Forest virus] [Telok Forest virus]QLA47020.1 N [Telok Forest virus] [Telok Forest virus]
MDGNNLPPIPNRGPISGATAGAGFGGATGGVGYGGNVAQPAAGGFLPPPPVPGARAQTPAVDFAYGIGDDRPASTFNPNDRYVDFTTRYADQLNADNIRSFFLHARDAKSKMANINKDTVRFTFGTLNVELVNNYRPRVAKRVVFDHELTLYRVTGYLARFLLESIRADARWSEAAVRIINPISAKLGLTWEAGADVYLSTLPGTEMFLGEFHYFPLAFLILRIKRGEIPAQMAAKALRQRVDGRLSAVWMADDVGQVEEAVKKVEQLRPVFSGISATMTAFLRHFGIRV